MKRMSVGGQAGIKKYNFFPAVDFKEDQKGALSWGWLGDLFWKRTDSGTVDWLANVGYCHSVIPSPPKFQSYFGRCSHLDQLFSTFLKSQNTVCDTVISPRASDPFPGPKICFEPLPPSLHSTSSRQISEGLATEERIETYSWPLSKSSALYLWMAYLVAPGHFFLHPGVMGTIMNHDFVIFVDPKWWYLEKDFSFSKATVVDIQNWCFWRAMIKPPKKDCWAGMDFSEWKYRILIPLPAHKYHHMFGISTYYIYISRVSMQR